MPHKVADTIQCFMAPGPKPNGLQAANDGLWIIDQGDNHVYKVDWKTGETLHDVPTDTVHSSGITLGDGYIWIASTYCSSVMAPPGDIPGRGRIGQDRPEIPVARRRRQCHPRASGCHSWTQVPGDR